MQYLEQLFRKENGLRREASYPKSVLLFIGLLIVVLVGESVANAWFFAQGNDFGLLGGALQALIVSVINLFIGLSIGIGCLRYMNHIKTGIKYTAGVLFVIFSFVALIFNVLVGHYRAALSIEPDNAKQLAVSNFLENPFGIPDWDSWILVIVGIAVTVLVAWKGKNSNDAYPGYKKCDKAMKDANEYVSELIVGWQERVKELHDEYCEQLDDLVHECRERADRMERSHRSIKQQISILDRYVEAHKQVYISCVRTYRQVNKQNREEPVPAYFSDIPIAKFEHNFNADLVLDKREHTKARKNEIEQNIPTIKSVLLEIYKSKVEEL